MRGTASSVYRVYRDASVYGGGMANQAPSDGPGTHFLDQMLFLRQHTKLTDCSPAALWKLSFVAEMLMRITKTKQN